MNADVSPASTPTALTREQLLDALDKDIADIVAIQSEAGWNHWVNLGALAALFWLALDIWGKKDFDVRRVLILTMSLTLTWDGLRRTFAQLDSSPLVKNQIKNRFLSLTGLLGAIRTSLLFELLKKACFLALVLYLRPSFLLWFEIYFTIGVFSGLATFAISYWDDMPETSQDHTFFPSWCMRSGFLFSAAANGVIAVVAWGVVWLDSSGISSQDLRMALIFSAIIYLISLDVQNRIPANFGGAYRSIRRNLAYGHISLDEARSHADIISIGGTLDQMLSLHLKKTLAATERAEIAYHQVRQKVFIYSDSVADWAELPDSSETKEKQSESVKYYGEVFKELNKADGLLQKAKKALEKFRSRFNQLTAQAQPGPIKSVENLTGQMDTKFKDIETSFTQTNNILELTHQVVKMWRDENALKEKLAKLRGARKEKPE